MGQINRIYYEFIKNFNGETPYAKNNATLFLFH